MVEQFRDGEFRPSHEASHSEGFDKALKEVALLRHSLLQLDTPNAKLAEAICLAQMILIIEDKQHISLDSSGQPYSAEEEAIAVLLDVVKDLKRKRSGQIADAIADLDPDR